MVASDSVAVEVTELPALTTEELEKTIEGVQEKVTVSTLLRNSLLSGREDTEVFSKAHQKYKKVMALCTERFGEVGPLDLRDPADREKLREQEAFRICRFAEVHITLPSPASQILRPNTITTQDLHHFFTSVVQINRRQVLYSLAVTISGRSFQVDPIGLERKDYVTALTAAARSFFVDDGGTRVQRYPLPILWWLIASPHGLAQMYTPAAARRPSRPI